MGINIGNYLTIEEALKDFEDIIQDDGSDYDKEGRRQGNTKGDFIDRQLNQRLKAEV